MQYNLPKKTSFFKAGYSKQKKEKIKETFYNALFIITIKFPN